MRRAKVSIQRVIPVLLFAIIALVWTAWGITQGALITRAAKSSRHEQTAKTLLTSFGNILTQIPVGEYEEWKTAAQNLRNKSEVRSQSLIWAGEFEMADLGSPSSARRRFQLAQQLAVPGSQLYNLAAFDTAEVNFRRGSYSEAADQLRQIGLSNAAGPFSRVTIGQWLRLIGDRNAYRSRNSKLGIYEPDRLSSDCGVLALNTALVARGTTIPVSALKNLCHTDGYGNCIEQLQSASQRLGYSARLVHASDKALILLTKPLVAFVEHDHFVAVIGADQKGITTVCPHCADGMPIHLSWRQWDAMESDTCLVLSKPGSSEDAAIRIALKSKGGYRNFLVHRAIGGGSHQIGALTSRLIGQISSVVAAYPITSYKVCSGTGWWMNVLQKLWNGSIKDGDPVNLSTGEIRSTPSADLNVYNPKGPSITWSRTYREFLGNTAAMSLSGLYLGYFWTVPYAVMMYDGSDSHHLQLVQGVNTSVTGSLYGTIGTGLTWQIVQAGTTLASSSSPNGWTVTSLTNGSCWVQAPSTITGTGFRIYWKAYGMTSALYVDFDVNTSTQVRQNEVATLAQNGTDKPTGSASWDIVSSGTVIANSSTTNWWNEHSLTSSSFQVSAPINASTSATYEVRTIDSYGAGHSAQFTVIPYSIAVSAGTKYLIMPDSTQVAVAPSSVPSSSQTSVACGIDAGSPFAVQWNYDSAQPFGVYQMTYRDGTKWFLSPVARNSVSVSNGVTVYQISSIQDRHGNSIYFDYSGYASSGNLLSLASINDSSGSPLLSVQRNSNGLITAINDKYNRSVYYTYDAGFNVITSASQIVTTGTVNPATRFAYTYAVANGEAGQYLQSITVPSPTGTGSSATTFSVDQTYGYCTGQIDPNGNRRLYTQVDANHTKVTVENSAGAVVFSYTAGFDANGNTTTITDGTNTTVVSTSTYGDPNDPFQPSQVQDGVGRVTRYTWDQYGNMLTSTTPRGVVTSNVYDYGHLSTGLLISSQAGSLPATQYTYDPITFDLLSVTGAVSGGSTATLSFTYDSLGNPMTMTKPDASGSPRITSYGYTIDGSYIQGEAIGQPITITDPLNNVSHVRYDSMGEVVSSTDPAGSTTIRAYNIAGQLTTTTLPASGQSGSGQGSVQNIYLFPGGPVIYHKVFDESNTLVRNIGEVYGPGGELLAETGDRISKSYNYDAAYRISTIADGMGNATSYAYNTAGYLSTITYPSGSQIQETSYNAAGQVLSETDPLGQVTDYVYGDPDGLITATQFPSNSTQNVAYTYDGYGRLATISGPQDTTSYTLGNVGETLSKTVQISGLSPVTLSYTYFADGSRASVNTPVGSISYGYDVLGRLASVTSPYSETFAWTYNNDGTIASKSLANGASVSFTYNALKQLTNLQNTVGSALVCSFSGMSYDGGGDLKSITETNNAAPLYSGTTAYSYDITGKLSLETSTRLGGYSYSYAYDSAGNATTFRNNSVSYNSSDQIANSGYSYDADGDPTTYAGNALSFNNVQQMTSFGTVLSATYGTNGLRESKAAAGALSSYIYDGQTPILELDSSGSIQAVNTVAGGMPLTRHTSIGSDFYAFDAQGGLAEELDSLGNVVGSFAFDAFGLPVSSAPSIDPFACFNAQFGGRVDPETGLVVDGPNYYDPSAGRLTAQPPGGETLGLENMQYAYPVPYQPLTQSQSTAFVIQAVGAGASAGSVIGGAPGAVLGGAFAGALSVAFTEANKPCGIDGGDMLRTAVVAGGAAYVVDAATGIIGESICAWLDSPVPVDLSKEDMWSSWGAARASADYASVSRVKSGVTAGLSVDGQVYIGFSGKITGERVNTSIVQDALDSLAVDNKFNGNCAEIDAINHAIRSGVNPAGGTMTAVKVRAGATNGQIMDPCPSCRGVMNQLGINY